ncbi:MAG: glycosyltransferase family 4 protein, partial [Candidatus Peribacteraceae bacterium]|nr:glycosyltransferase family 4 protein [Candidatus Peribacteraceae bacterium]
LAAFYRSIDVLILPSRDNDPFGLVVAEAMACGTPVIVTDQCGIAGYLTNGEDALIAGANSEKALREAIIRMQDSSLRERLGRAGQKTASKNFAVESMVETYEKLLLA